MAREITDEDGIDGFFGYAEWKRLHGARCPVLRKQPAQEKTIPRIDANTPTPIMIVGIFASSQFRIP